MIIVLKHIVMKTPITKGLLMVALIGLIVACTETKKDVANDIRFDTIEVEKTYNLLENPENPNCNLQIKFTYPSAYGNKEVLKKIQTQFVSSYFGDAYEGLSPEEAVKKYTEDYIEAYKDLEDDFATEMKRAKDSPVGSWFSYYEMSENETVYNRNGLLSYMVAFENYTGGAHGAHSYFNHVIDLKTGEPVLEKDVFIEDFEDELAELLVAEIAKQNEVSDPKELEDMGFFSVDEIYPNGNFLVNETGITYSFNEYEIAAYVVGVIHVHLPYEGIERLLQQESPISHLIAK